MLTESDFASYLKLIRYLSEEKDTFGQMDILEVISDAVKKDLELLRIESNRVKFKISENTREVFMAAVLKFINIHGRSKKRQKVAFIISVLGSSKEQGFITFKQKKWLFEYLIEVYKEIGITVTNNDLNDAIERVVS